MIGDREIASTVAEAAGPNTTGPKDHHLGVFPYRPMYGRCRWCAPAIKQAVPPDLDWFRIDTRTLEQS